MRPSDLLQLRPEGLFCPPAGVYIDPHRVVGRAVITHAHGDHCRPGVRQVLATPETLAIADARHGKKAFPKTQPVAYGAPLRVGDAVITLFPAGHVLGSAQVLIEAGGARAVVSGDYKRAPDPSCAAFEPVPCDLFVTEATFALPVFRHPPAQAEIGRLLASLEALPHRAHVIAAYALGKTQRLIAELRQAGHDRPIFVHPKLVPLCRLYERFGVPLGPLTQLGGQGAALRGEIVIAPPNHLGDKPLSRLPDPLLVGASGWMRVRRLARQRGMELPLVISDHADWPELTATIQETGAGVVWVTHGTEAALCRWCAQRGIDARPLSIAGRGEAA